MEGSESEGLALQRSLSDWCCMKMTPVIERVLDRASSPDVHICIERVEIDVGDLNLARLEHDLAEAVGQALEKQISKQILHPGITTQPPTPGNIRYLTAQDSINKALIHFLTTGSLPWSFRLPAGQNLAESGRLWHPALERKRFHPVNPGFRNCQKEIDPAVFSQVSDDLAYSART
jgi:Contractile injection system tape measure protein